jgi:hypothetical protein
MAAGTKQLVVDSEDGTTRDARPPMFAPVRLLRARSRQKHSRQDIEKLMSSIKGHAALHASLASVIVHKGRATVVFDNARRDRFESGTKLDGIPKSNRPLFRDDTQPM